MFCLIVDKHRASAWEHYGRVVSYSLPFGGGANALR